MRKITALIIDDGAVYRAVLADVLGSFAEIEVVGSAPGCDAAMEMLALRPADVVFCDVHMPDKDGVATLIEIKARFPAAVVIMISGISNRSAPLVTKALELGALDFIPKPAAKSIEENSAQLKESIKRILSMINIRLNLQESRIIRTGTAAAVPRTGIAAGRKSPDIAAVAIGISTGGPEALSKLIPLISSSISVPILIVQHIPAQFTKSVADSLDNRSAIRVVEARNGMIIEPATAYIAPGGRHMTARRALDHCEIGINDGPPENSCRPSVDVLFRSMGIAYGESRIIAVVMTGMGSDGLLGVRALKRNNCWCITQTADSCAVYGMPRAVDEAGLSDKSLDIEGIASEIHFLLRCGATTIAAKGAL